MSLLVSARRGRSSSVARLAASLGSLLLFAASLSAHPSPNAAVLLDFQRESVAVELFLPLSELELGFGQPLAATPADVLPRHQAALKSYLAAHIHPVAPDGRPWQVEVSDEMSVRLKEEPVDLMAHAQLRPPPGAPLRKFTLNYDVIAHEVNSHRAFVFIRNDWNNARFSSQPPEVIGLIHFEDKSVEVDCSTGSPWRGFQSVLRLGMTHIAEGTDHLLFLLVLLLPAPLLVAAKKWSGPRSLSGSVLQLVKIVTAFTIGHSITLAFGAVGWVHLPATPVEVLIAFSILISALHALRPIFPGREPWIAAGFGLVHGLAFAGTIAGFGFTPWYMALSILAFNLGIELMQLAVVAMIMPWLLLLSRTPFYNAVRVIGATGAACAALTWIGERAFSWPNPLDQLVTTIAQHALWLIATLAALALFAFWQQTRQALRANS